MNVNDSVNNAAKTNCCFFCIKASFDFINNIMSNFMTVKMKSWTIKYSIAVFFELCE